MLGSQVCTDSVSRRLGGLGNFDDVLELQRVVTAAILYGYFNVHGFNGQFSLEMIPKILMMGVLGAGSGKNKDDKLTKMFIEQTKRLLREFGPVRSEGAASSKLRPFYSEIQPPALEHWMKVAIQQRFIDPLLSVEAQ